LAIALFFRREFGAVVKRCGLNIQQQRRRGAQKRRSRRLQREATMTLTWIAKRLHMGTTGSPANLLRDAKRK